MRNLILVLYSLVGIAGVYMLIMRLMKKEVRMLTGILHGFAGLIGIAMLIVLSTYSDRTAPVIPIILFFLAFLIGGGVFSARLFGKGKPGVWVILIHAFIAAAGIFALFTGS